MTEVSIKKHINNKSLCISLIVVCFLSITVLGIYIKSSPKQRVFKVDVERIIKETVHSKLKNESSDEAVKLETKLRLKRLEAILKEIAENENAVIVNKKAVLSGALDITEVVSDLMKEGEYEN